MAALNELALNWALLVLLRAMQLIIELLCTAVVLSLFTAFSEPPLEGGTGFSN